MINIKKNRDKQAGIGLMEISIVLIIVGLLMGFLLPFGMQTIRKTRLEQIRSQIHYYITLIDNLKSEDPNNFSSLFPESPSSESWEKIGIPLSGAQSDSSDSFIGLPCVLGGYFVIKSAWLNGDMRNILMVGVINYERNLEGVLTKSEYEMLKRNIKHETYFGHVEKGNGNGTLCIIFKD